jgi:hypothetical protein
MVVPMSEMGGFNVTEIVSEPNGGALIAVDFSYSIGTVELRS